jgi:hypothetical protein
MMTKRNCLRSLAVLALSLASSWAGAAQARVDVTGTWLFTVTTSAGNGTPTVTLKHDGEKLSGHYSSSQLGEADLTGTVKGNTVSFSFGVDVQGVHLDVTYSGTIEGQDSMKGTLKLGGLGEGTFTGKRQ